MMFFCLRFPVEFFCSLGVIMGTKQLTNYVCTTSETEDEVGPVKLVKATTSYLLLTVPRR